MDAKPCNWPGALAPQVVVMDLTMPHLNGFEAARQISKHLPGLAC